MRKDLVMTSRLPRWILLGLLPAAGGCSSGVSGWRCFHGFSSPAVGADGAVYAVARNGVIRKFKGSN
jgi:hypothetical protein